MSKLLLESTAAAQWHSLVTEAERECKASLSEEVESYLVFLLMRFVNQPDLADKVMALDFLHGIQDENHDVLRGVGDECLLYAGLFPGRAERRRVRISYFVHLGQNAYAILANEGHRELASLFAHLRDAFVELTDVMHVMRELSDQGPSLSPVEAQEFWMDVGSGHAFKTLQQYTHSQEPLAVKWPLDLTSH